MSIPAIIYIYFFYILCKQINIQKVLLHRFKKKFTFKMCFHSTYLNGETFSKIKETLGLKCPLTTMSVVALHEDNNWTCVFMTLENANHCRLCPCTEVTTGSYHGCVLCESIMVVLTLVSTSVINKSSVYKSRYSYNRWYDLKLVLNYHKNGA